MAEITASLVKELREKTGAGMMECKKALVETGGDLEAAVDELRKRGQVIAQKKGSRAMKEGRIFARVTDKAGVMVELNCETDFVAKNEEFVKLGNKLSQIVADQAPCCVEALTGVKLEDGQTVSETLTAAIAKVGENQAISRFVRIESDSKGAGAIAAYVHPPGKLGVLIQLEADNAAALKSEAVQHLGRDLAMQVAAAAPVCIDRASVPADVLAREKAIYVDQVKMEGKPEKIWDKIVEGKMVKFYKQACLLEQEFVKDPDLTIEKLLAKVGKEAGSAIKVARFERYEVGGAADKSE
ncbi:translation elongation factor Ts [bacterium]|nr:translation elongation factor Ts [bacterium]